MAFNSTGSGRDYCWTTHVIFQLKEGPPGRPALERALEQEVSHVKRRTDLPGARDYPGCLRPWTSLLPRQRSV